MEDEKKIVSFDRYKELKERVQKEINRRNLIYDFKTINEFYENSQTIISKQHLNGIINPLKEINADKANTFNTIIIKDLSSLEKYVKQLEDEPINIGCDGQCQVECIIICSETCGGYCDWDCTEECADWCDAGCTSSCDWDNCENGCDARCMHGNV